MLHATLFAVLRLYFYAVSVYDRQPLIAINLLVASQRQFLSLRTVISNLAKSVELPIVHHTARPIIFTCTSHFITANSKSKQTNNMLTALRTAIRPTARLPSQVNLKVAKPMAIRFVSTSMSPFLFLMLYSYSYGEV